MTPSLAREHRRPIRYSVMNMDRLPICKGNPEPSEDESDFIEEFTFEGATFSTKDRLFYGTIVVRF